MLEWLVLPLLGYIVYLFREEFEKLPERFVRRQLRDLPADERSELEQEFFAILAAETTLGKFVQAWQVRGHRQSEQPSTSRLGELQADLLAATNAVQTGFDGVDEIIGGLKPSDLIVVASEPGMGKTTFAMNIAENVAISAKMPVAVFSSKMPGEQLAMRMISSLGRIDQHHIRTGQLTDEDWPRITSAVHMLSEANLFIDDTPAMSLGDVRARARRLKHKHGLGLIVIDSHWLMQVPGSSENRETEISEISRGLKALAKELDVPVIALSRLNRSLKLRTDKRPIMSDLPESRAIEQDADVVMFIYRDEVYNQASLDRGMAEIIIAKQPNGPIGKSMLTFLGKYTKFENYIPEMYSNEEPW